MKKLETTVRKESELTAVDLSKEDEAFVKECKALAEMVMKKYPELKEACEKHIRDADARLAELKLS